jgi:hypothetical protein
MAEREPSKEEKMGKLTKDELVEWLITFDLQERLLFAKALISLVGKEEAKKIISRTVTDTWYKRGRATAEELGNPEDLDSYIDIMIKRMARNPIAPPLEIVERTKNRVIFRETGCVIADVFEKFKKNVAEVARFGGDEVMEVSKARCDMDTAWANGFNPKMKFERTKFFLDGEGCCEFIAEIEE